MLLSVSCKIVLNWSWQLFTFQYIRVSSVMLQQCWLKCVNVTEIDGVCMCFAFVCLKWVIIVVLVLVAVSIFLVQLPDNWFVCWQQSCRYIGYIVTWYVRMVFMMAEQMNANRSAVHRNSRQTVTDAHKSQNYPTERTLLLINNYSDC